MRSLLKASMYDIEDTLHESEDRKGDDRSGGKTSSRY